jgi:hypothetical protein
MPVHERVRTDMSGVRPLPCLVRTGGYEKGAGVADVFGIATRAIDENGDG